MPWVFNPFTGELDFRRISQDSVEKITAFYTANETISALNLVKSDGSNLVSKAEPDSDTNARVLGIALNGGNATDSIEVLSFGTLEDAAFSGFTLNAPLYLGTTSFLTESAPTLPASQFNSLIGKYLGSNTVFINMDEPIKL